MTMNKFMADVDDLIFDGQDHAERAWIFLCFLRVSKISTMRNRFSEISRKRLRKN